MSIIKKKHKKLITRVGRDVTILERSFIAGGNISAATLENSLLIPHKELPYGSSNSTLKTQKNENIMLEALPPTEICTQMFMVA